MPHHLLPHLSLLPPSLPPSCFLPSTGVVLLWSQRVKEFRRSERKRQPCKSTLRATQRDQEIYCVAAFIRAVLHTDLEYIQNKWEMTKLSILKNGCVLNRHLICASFSSSNVKIVCPIFCKMGKVATWHVQITLPYLTLRCRNNILCCPAFFTVFFYRHHD